MERRDRGEGEEGEEGLRRNRVDEDDNKEVEKKCGRERGAEEDTSNGRRRWLEERRNERARKSTREEPHGRTDELFSNARIERVRATTTIRSQGRSLLLPRSGDLSGIYYPPFARYDDPSSLLFHTACLPACLPDCRPSFAARCK